MKLTGIFHFLLAASLAITVSCKGDHDHSEEEEDHHSHNDEIILDPASAKEFGVEYEIINRGKFYDVIKTSGIIEASNSDISNVTAKKRGIITLSPGVNVGKEVKSGEKIATITVDGVEGGDISQAAIANLNAAKAEYERIKPLYEEKLVTASTFREVERAYLEAQALAGGGKTSGATAVISSGNGVIQNLFVKSGDLVDAGTPVAVISTNSRQMLRADLPAREHRHLTELESANFIPEGSDEVIRLDEYEGKRVTGSGMNVTNGYIPVYFSFTGNGYLSPGGYAEVYLLCGERDGVISVPRGGLIEIQGNKYVYVKEDDHGYEKRLVTTGASDGDRIEILSGLEEGDMIVSKGASVIRMAEISAVAPEGHSHNH